MSTPEPFTKQSIITTSDQDALQIKDIKGDIVGWIDASGTGQGNLASGGGGTPGGSNTQVQFNDSGSFGGNSNLAFNKSVNTVGGVGIGPGNTPGQIDPISGETPGGTGISILDVTQSISSASLPNGYGATLVSGLEANPSGNNSSAYYSGWILANSKSTNTHNIGQIVGTLIEADHFGSGAVTNITGITGSAFNDGAGSATFVTALIFGAQNTGSGPVTNVRGVVVQNGGAAGSGTVTNNYGLQISSPATAAVVSHNYAIRIEDQTGGGANNPDTWAIFVAAAADKSQLGTFRTGQFTVAALPSGIEGLQAYATNGRKVGEGPGSGTGVPVYFSNGSWRVFSTDAAVQS
jgi:hypothetical protein